MILILRYYIYLKTKLNIEEINLFQFNLFKQKSINSCINKKNFIKKLKVQNNQFAKFFFASNHSIQYNLMYNLPENCFHKDKNFASNHNLELNCNQVSPIYMLLNLD